jgi:hypothetical protein
MARDEVRPARHLLVALRLDAVLAEQRLDVRDARLLVPRRVRRVEPDQVAQQLDGVRWKAFDHSSASAASSRSTSPGVL